ncbi:MAG TPA: hypothetical protein VF620_10320 [Allosphingosinicella sp.]
MAFPAHSALAALAGAALLGAPALAQSEAWGRMAQEDLKAARAFVEETHPAAVPDSGDTVFLAQLHKGYAEAQELAREARTFGGYRAAISRFAAAFDDPHIASASWVQPDNFWPGFLVSSRRGGWKVVPGGAADGPEAGAELVACDGKAPDALAAEWLGPFTGSWHVAAQRMRTSSSLLLDSGNPYQPRVESCDVRSGDGKVATHKLNWRRIGRGDLGRQFEKLGPFASQDVGLRSFEGRGWWIRLGTLSQAALPLMKEVEARQSEIREAPFVVVDLRGNDGGATFISDRIAEVIYGTAAVDSATYPKGAREPQKVVWRATPRTLKTAEAYVERAVRVGGADHPLVLGMMAQRDAIQTALARGSALAEAPASVDPQAALRKRDSVKKPPRVILVTDRICFSSCLQAARLFRNLGATHVGQETSANTRYSNAITTDLPSGLSNFSSLQAYWTYVPMRLGPYTPTLILDVDLADDRAVEAEVGKLLASRRKGK